jgi:hypothetical protein
VPAVLAFHTDRLTVRELVVDGFRGPQAPRAGAAIMLARGEGFVVRDSRAAAGTDMLVEATEVTGRRLLAGNDVRSARWAARPASLGPPEAPATGRGGTAQDR